MLKLTGLALDHLAQMAQQKITLGHAQPMTKIFYRCYHLAGFTYTRIYNSLNCLI